MGKREAVLGTGVRIAAGALRPRNDGFNFTKNIEIYSKYVGLSMMCYRLGKENKTFLGEIQLRGRMGKLLYCLCQTASCLAKSSKE